ncbi:MAG: hypothetical protein ABIZ56_03445, partial [Chthoniobacteraceae bacterium]
MKTPRLLAVSIASLLLTLPTTHAVNDTWDGGSPLNDNLNTNANWEDDSAPISSGALNNLIFAGVQRLTPNVSVEFSTRGIFFANPAGPFVIGGQPLHVGPDGIVNFDTQTMTFTNPVDFSASGFPAINAAAGGLNFTNTVTLALSELTVTGSAPTVFHEIVLPDSDPSPGHLRKEGSGTMTWTPAAPTPFSVIVDAGTLTLAADGFANVFTSLIVVNGTSILNLNESLTLNATEILREAGAQIHLAAGKTLTLQNGASAIITGAFANTTASAITVTGASSTFSTTSTLTLGGGSTTTVVLGASLSAGTGAVNVGTSGDGVVNVTNGSFFDGGNLAVGLSGNAGSVIFSGGSTGTFGNIDVDASSVAGTSGALSIQSGA